MVRAKKNPGQLTGHITNPCRYMVWHLRDGLLMFLADTNWSSFLDRLHWWHRHRWSRYWNGSLLTTHHCSTHSKHYTNTRYCVYTPVCCDLETIHRENKSMNGTFSLGKGGQIYIYLGSQVRSVECSSNTFKYEIKKRLILVID